MSIVRYLPCGCGIDGEGGRDYCPVCATEQMSKQDLNVNRVLLYDRDTRELVHDITLPGTIPKGDWLASFIYKDPEQPIRSLADAQDLLLTPGEILEAITETISLNDEVESPSIIYLEGEERDTALIKAQLAKVKQHYEQKVKKAYAEGFDNGRMSRGLPND